MTAAAVLQPTAIERYYRFHSRIYDATRWSFLFGRHSILRLLPGQPARILEVGCGTGLNLVNLCRQFPQATIAGVDLSETMLDLARRKTAPFADRVQLEQRAYSAPFAATSFDLVLFSYALSMFNPGYEAALTAAHADLASGGHLAVVDFHDSPFRTFECWMGVNHVRMNGQLRPLARSLFTPRIDRLCPAYGGVWRYLLFIGHKT